MQPESSQERMTLRKLRQTVETGGKFAVLTCYDATTARWLSRGGVPVLLVGDSAANVILGYDQSIFAPLEFMITITAAVRRGAPQALLLADMPFMSYQADDAQAIRNAGRFMTEGMADLVKVEVDEEYVDLVKKMSRAGIPVVAHIGWRPQTARHAGVRTAVVAGKTSQDVARLVALAERMEQAGAAMLLVEQCTAETSKQIIDRVRIPVIGCGAGPACHGHVVVLQDLLGMSDHYPSFVKPMGNVGEQVSKVAADWVKLVGSGEYLKSDHPYRMKN